MQQKDRLIVIIPDHLAGNRDLAHKIFWMAADEQNDVIFLTLVDHEENLLPTTLSMITMKAITANNRLNVAYKITRTALWEKAFREIYRPGDRVTCQQEHIIKTGLVTAAPLDQYLREILGFDAISLSGFYHPRKRPTFRQWLHDVIVWSAFFLALFCFLALEIKL